ncbi:MAG: hypothetical protein J0G29_04060 [Alphaproteobacteria bacterium]|nr:hypothetical protein [Alphaproteobacteria bacterium]OJV46435.1 MAG: hypothetical protein BGO28_02500 [Alphaproteobacteria bacterium 43-37]
MFNKKYSHKVLLGFVFLVWGGCQGHTSMPAMKMTQDSVGLAVEGINVQLAANSGLDNSGQWVEVPFATQVKNWFSSRFKPVGGEKVGYIVVNLAALKQTNLANGNSSKDVISGQPSEQYEAEIDVRFEIRDSMGFAEKFAAAKIHRTATVLGDITLAQRQALIQKLINHAIEDADQELLQSAKEFLPLLIQSQI